MKRTLVCILLAIAAVAARAADGTSFSGTLFVWPNWTYVSTSWAAVATETFPAKLLEQTHANWTNANQMNAFAHMTVTVSNAAQTISCAAFTNGFGASVNFKRANYLAVYARTNNAGDIQIGGIADHLLIADTNATINVRPGGILLLTAPNAIGYESTGKVIRVSTTTEANTTADVYLGGVQ